MRKQAKNADKSFGLSVTSKSLGTRPVHRRPQVLEPKEFNSIKTQEKFLQEQVEQFMITATKERRENEVQSQDPMTTELGLGSFATEPPASSQNSQDACSHPTPEMQHFMKPRSRMQVNSQNFLVKENKGLQPESALDQINQTTVQSRRQSRKTITNVLNPLKNLSSKEQISALQETKTRVSKFVEMFRNAENNAQLDIDVSEEIMRVSKEVLSSFRPLTTKAATLSHETVNDNVFSAKGFLNSPPMSIQRLTMEEKPQSQVGLKHNFSRTMAARRNMYTHQQQVQQHSSLHRKHASSFGPQVFVQSSQVYKLSKNLPDIFKGGAQKPDANQLLSQMISPRQAPADVRLRGMSATQPTRVRPIVVPEDKPKTQQRFYQFDYTQPIDHTFKTSTVGVKPLSPDNKSLKARSHVKVPEYLQQHIGVRQSVKTATTYLQPLSQPILLSKTTTESIDQGVNQACTQTESVQFEPLSTGTGTQADQLPGAVAIKPLDAYPIEMVKAPKPQVQPPISKKRISLLLGQVKIDAGSNLSSKRHHSSRSVHSNQSRTQSPLLQKQPRLFDDPFPQSSHHSSSYRTQSDLALRAQKVSLQDSSSKSIQQIKLHILNDSISKVSNDETQLKLRPHERISNHLLEIHKDPNAILPVSADLELTSILDKACHKINNEFQWNQVAQIPLHKTEEENFLSELHSVDPKAIDVLCASGKKEPLRPVGISSDCILPSSATLSNERDQPEEATQQYDYDTMLAVETNEVDTLEEYNSALKRKIVHPLFKLNQRPDVIEVIYLDVFKTMMNVGKLDLYAYVSEDYLDETKPAPADVVRSINAKISYAKYLVNMKVQEEEEIKAMQNSRQSTQLGGLQVLGFTSLMKSTKIEKNFRISQLTMEAERHSLGFEVMMNTINNNNKQLLHVNPYQSEVTGLELSLNKECSPRSLKRKKYSSESVNTENIDLEDVQIRDCNKRRIVFDVVEASSLTQVTVKLEIESEAILRLQRKVSKYQTKRIEKVLPLVFFDNFQEECQSIKDNISHRVQSRMPEFQVCVTMKEVTSDGKEKRIIKSGKCLDYLEDTKQFLVEFDDQSKIVTSRLCMLFADLEKLSDLEARRVNAMTLQKLAFVRLNCERIFVDEILQLYLKDRQPAFITNEIIKRLSVLLKQINGNEEKMKKVREMIAQVEAVFSYSQVKSATLRELEKENPKFACMITGYKIVRTRSKAVPYYGLAAFEQNGGPIKHFIEKKQSIELLQNHSHLGKICFKQAMAFVQSKRLEVLDAQAAFCIPFGDYQLQILAPILNKKKVKLEKLFNEFPQKDTLICQAQIILLQRYLNLLNEDYYSRITHYVEKMIYKEFPVVTTSVNAVTETSQLNPFLRSFFQSLAIFQGGHLFAKLESELVRYLNFLLAFACRSIEFKASAESVGLDLSKFDYLLKSKAFITIDVEIQKRETLKKDTTKKKGQQTKKQQILSIIRQLRRRVSKYVVNTKPDLESIYNSLMAVLHNICSLFKEVKRPEKKIFPHLNLKQEFIQVSQAVADDNPQSVKEKENTTQTDLTTLDECQVKKEYIEYIIGESIDLSTEQVKSLGDYTKYIGKTLDRYLFECKMDLYEERAMNFDSEDEESDESIDSKLLDEQYAVNLKKQVTTEWVVEEIEKIELTNKNHQEFYSKLNEASQNLVFQIKPEYDLGLTQIECYGLKKLAMEQTNKLLFEYQKMLSQKFEEMCLQTLERNREIWKRITENNINDIDKTIGQMQYIESLQADDILNDTRLQLINVQNYRFFLDDIRIQLQGDLFDNMKELYAFPKKLNNQLSLKYQELRSQWQGIKQRLKEHSLDLRTVLKKLKRQFDYFRLVGLMKREDIDKVINPINKNHLQEILAYSEEDRANEEKANGIIWDPHFVDQWVGKMTELTEKLEQCEAQIKQLNSREEQLSIEQTQFPEFKVVKRESYPVIQLWQVIGEFNIKHYYEWRTKFVSTLNIEEVDDCVTKWLQQLGAAARNTNVQNYEGPKQFIHFMRVAMKVIQDMMPVLTALKAKGLERRHFMQIQEETGLVINLMKMKLRELINLKISKGPHFERIKNISESAQKEYQIKVSIEQIEQDVFNAPIIIAPYKDSGSYIVKGVEEYLQLLEECDLKNSTMLQSPFSKYYKDRLDRMDRDLKDIIRFYTSWMSIQKNWAYLVPIFSQKDIATQMLAEQQLFIEKEAEYREIMKWAVTESCKTYRQFAQRDRIGDQVFLLGRDFDYLMKVLLQYLEAKRNFFPRLYFLSNEQIIEFVGMVDDVFILQKNLFKLFEGIAELNMDFSSSAESKVDRLVMIVQHKSNSIGAQVNEEKKELELRIQSGEIKQEAQQRKKLKTKKEVLKAFERKTYAQEKKEKLRLMQLRSNGSNPEIYGIKNANGEEILFTETIAITIGIEHWLRQLETVMQETVSETARNSILNFANETAKDEQKGFIKWIEQWPTQFLLICLEFNFSSSVNTYLRRLKEYVPGSEIVQTIKKPQQQMTSSMTGKNSKRITSPQAEVPKITKPDEWDFFFKKLHAKYNDEIKQLTQLVKVQLDKNTRQKVNNLIITRVYHRDTAENLLNSAQHKATSFLWNLFMKFDCTLFSDIAYENYLRGSQRKQLDKIQNLNKNENIDKLLIKAMQAHNIPIPKNKLLPEPRDTGMQVGTKQTGQLVVPQAKAVDKRPSAIIPDSMQDAQMGSNYQRGSNMQATLRPGNIEIEIITATKPYGFEFLENSSRLVITPLTERAFQCLFLALHYDYGGAPIGPVGTGKTETIKEMSKRCARNCFVFNCQSGIDFESMSKFFKGLAASGTWTCFDEFNRLEVTVLSIISQLIITIQEAKHAKATKIVIETSEITLDTECALFITMNPFFLGRTQLPDNLKSLFRNITMVVPDSMFIAEIMLYSAGFVNAKQLALKIQRTFNLASEQLSEQKHYDFGLRAIKTVLLHAQQIKLRAQNVKSHDMIEQEEATQLLCDYLSLIKPPVKKMTTKLKQSGRKRNRLGGEKTKRGDVNRFKTVDDSDSTEIEELKVADVSPEIVIELSPKQTQISNVGFDDVIADQQKKWVEFQKQLGISSNLDVNALTPNSMLDIAQRMLPDGAQKLIKITENSSSVKLDSDRCDKTVQSGDFLAETIMTNPAPSNDSDSVSVSGDQHKLSRQSQSSGDVILRENLVINVDFIKIQLGYRCSGKTIKDDQLEDFFVYRALLDKSLPKLVANDSKLFQNILMDVFPKTPIPNLNLGDLQEAIKHVLQQNRLHESDDIIQNSLNINEAIMSRHGVMLVGEAMSGKTQALQMVVEALNYMHAQEFQRRSNSFLIEKAIKMAIPWAEKDGQIVPLNPSVRNEQYFKLKEEETRLLKRTCTHKGIENRILNPKAVSIKSLMGNYEEQNREWTDGLMTHYMRQASNDKSGRRQLITFDSSIEPDWVENMNSVLDDNMRLTLITGESIFLTKQMTVVLETADLQDTSPATISRCAVVYFRHENLPIKAEFNKWLLSLPTILNDQLERIDIFVNFFMSEIFENFLIKDYLIYPVTRQWVFSNFIKIFNSLIIDYRSVRHRDAKAIASLKAIQYRLTSEKLPQESFKNVRETSVKKTVSKQSMKDVLHKSHQASSDLNSLLLRKEQMSFEQQKQQHAIFRKNTTTKQISITPHDSPKKQSDKEPSDDYIKDTQSVSKRRVSKQWLLFGGEQKSMSDMDESNVDKKKVAPPDYNFIEDEVCFQNSIRYKSVWIDSMLIQSLLYSVGSLLNERGKLVFQRFIKETVANCSYQTTPQGSMDFDDYEPEDALTVETLNKRVYTPTVQFVIGTFKRINVDLPTHGSLFDYFFDPATNMWQSWDHVATSVERFDSRNKNLFNIYIDTTDCFRYKFILERMQSSNQSLLFLGPTAVGKSWMIRNYAHTQPMKKTWSYRTLLCSSYTTGESLAQNLEIDMLLGSNRTLSPQTNKKVLVFIDDINLAQKDKYSIQGASEVLRQWFDYGGWYNHTPIFFKQVRDIVFIATMSVKASTHELLPKRMCWHWATVGFQNHSGHHIEQIFTQICQKSIGLFWLKQLTQFAIDKIKEATFSFYREYNLNFQITPSSFLQRLNKRHCLQILNSITDTYPNAIRKYDAVPRLWFSEVVRTVIDRYEEGNERQVLIRLAKKICNEVFTFQEIMLPEKIDDPQYCYGLPEFEEKTYMQVPPDDGKKLQQVLADVVADYNKFHFKKPIEIVIFNTVIEKTIKINRAIHLANTVTILFAEEGSGASQIVKLAIHMAKSTGQEFMHPDTRRNAKDDYRTELREILKLASLESKHQVVLNVKECDLLQPGLFEDLNALAAHGELLEIFDREQLEQLVHQGRFVFSRNRDKEKSREQILECIRQKCREDFKIFLNLSPRSQIVAKKLVQFNHIVNCSAMIQFGEWSRQGFEHIAQKFLTEQDVQIDNHKEVVNQMINMYFDAVKEKNNFNNEQSHIIYIEPLHFNNFCYVYREIFLKRMADLIQYKDRFSKGLNGIEKIETETNRVQEKLSKEFPKLIESQKYLEKKLEESNLQKSIFEQRIKAVLMEEAELNFQLEEAKRIRETCERKLKEVIPILNDAIEGLLLIKKEDIDEIKSYKNPTLTLKTLMKAVCIVLRVPPLITKDKDGNGFTKDYWTACLGPQVLGDKQIVKKLTTIEPKLLDADVIAKLEKICAKEELKAGTVKHACLAARGINKWLKAVRDYYFVYKTSVPTRDKMILSELQYRKIETALSEKNAEVKTIEENLEKLAKKFAAKDAKIRLFQKKISDSFMIKTKASRLLNALISEKQKWVVFESVAITKLRNNEGDSLIGAGMVCFLAPFPQSFRNDMFAKWQKEIEKSKIPVTHDLNFNMQFGEPLVVKQWVENGLSNDQYSIQNAIILQLCQMQTLLIDPQGQANKWLHKEIEDVKVINVETTKYIKEIIMALKFGQVVLLEVLTDTLPRELYQIVKLSKDKQRNSVRQNTIVLDNQVIQVHQDFKIYITSMSKAPDFGSELSLICNFINFSVTKEAFTQQILSLILTELESEMNDNIVDYRRMTLAKLVELQAIEAEILEMLREGVADQTMILEDSIIDRLAESGHLGKQIANVLHEIDKNMKAISQVSAVYKPAADRACQFFFLAQELHKLNPMYVFSHQWFFEIFVNKLKELQTLTIKHKSDWIQSEFTRHFYEQICSTLFEKDKLIFSFLCAYKVLEIECKLDMRLVEIFIKGPLQEAQDFIDLAIELIKREGKGTESKRGGQQAVQRAKKALSMADKTVVGRLGKAFQDRSVQHTQRQQSVPQLI